MEEVRVSQEELIQQDLGRQLGEKAIEIAEWRSRAIVLEAQVLSLKSENQRLAALVRSFEAGVMESMADEGVEVPESPIEEVKDEDIPTS